MKQLLFSMLALYICISSTAQTPIPADKGITYGAGTSDQGAISADQLSQALTNNAFSGKIFGTVTEVCQEKGCWMKIKPANGDLIMVKFKDYGFFMPKNIVGKTVVLEGDASIKETSVDMLRHYAEDAGKSRAEIKKIKKPKRELQFVAKGVLVR